MALALARRLLALALVLGLVGQISCGIDAIEEVEDPEAEGQVSTGKADGTGYSPCQTAAVLAFLNSESTDVDALRALKLSTRAAQGLVAHRDGPDATFGTADDDPFDDLVEVDKVKWVGPWSISVLVQAVEDQCAAGGVQAEVVFSPQPYSQSHVVKIAQLIDSAKSSLDVAMYSLSDAGAKAALDRAVGRGVKVRFIFEDGNADSKDPAGSKSAGLEQLGINVRYVNKIMHHKFMIVDGPRDDTSTAASATLVTGSGNWSNGAATRYDENTLFLTGVPRVVLAYQAEFNLMWDHSRDFVWDSTLPYEKSTAVIDTSNLPADPSSDSLFTSGNFKVSSTGTTFYIVRGRNSVADVIVNEILGAQSSIDVASGHLRSRPISEALMAAKAANPSLKIRVYLDGQEYLAASTHAKQLSDLAACLVKAGTSQAKQEDCKDKGFLFSYQVSEEAGIDLRYKYYAYRWDYSYAVQMHHKYLVIDGKTLIAGSYNLSDNAEHKTFENMVVLRAPEFAGLIAKYEANFNTMWSTDADGSQLADLQQKITTSSSIPLVFDPLALTWQQVNNLKSLIVANCPQVNSTEYRDDPASHKYCPRP
jgi:phosphatidylserine/phosphatidylglycerophosphate/cardiolipin synthase-like enzyme